LASTGIPHHTADEGDIIITAGEKNITFTATDEVTS